MIVTAAADVSILRPETGRFTDTPIVELPVRLLLAGLPFTKMTDVVNAIVYAATSPDAGGVSLPVDPKGVLLLPHDVSALGTDGFHQVFERRAKGLIRFVSIILKPCLGLKRGMRWARAEGVFLCGETLRRRTAPW